ncbi:MAG: ATP-binding protein, partial [Congregibacter sp.]|nr:ATP-binding protein [Congregibacter sp.]
MVNGDAGRLSQVIRNLVSNAIKFTERGMVTVSLSTESANQGIAVYLEVQDTGVGIPVDAQEHIFEAFKQADESTTRRFGGTGLGLSISQQLANMMQGSISVKRLPGVGTTFSAVMYVNE